MPCFSAFHPLVTCLADMDTAAVNVGVQMSLAGALISFPLDKSVVRRLLDHVIGLLIYQEIHF